MTPRKVRFPGGRTVVFRKDAATSWDKAAKRAVAKRNLKAACAAPGAPRAACKVVRRGR